MKNRLKNYKWNFYNFKSFSYIEWWYKKLIKKIFWKKWKIGYIKVDIKIIIITLIHYEYKIIHDNKFMFF